MLRESDDIMSSTEALLSMPAGDVMSAERHLSALERMPKWMICIPLVFQWIWLSVRYRSLTLPSSVNPSITSGGLIGEGKLEYFDGMGPLARGATAQYVGVSTGGSWSLEELANTMFDNGLDFPIIAKPDLGLCGYGVRRVDDIAQLGAYVNSFPKNETIVLQRYLPEAGEAGIFYVRDKGTGNGVLLGLALRYFPRVIGDGIRSVGSLMVEDRRLSRLLNSAFHENFANTDKIPAMGEVVRLSTIGSTRVGGLYCDGSELISPKLTLAIDAIARDMPQFHFGRFDVRFDNIEELAEGRGFTIIEINGAGSEAIQAWDPNIGLLDGFRIIFAKQKALFKVADQMRNGGARPIGLLQLAKLFLRQQRLLALYPPSN
jgi:hypothetical protein